MSRKQLARSGGDLSALGRDDSGCTMLHLDMDSFFVSVELLSRPELKGRPVIVGGRAGRGVVVSASYEARDFGVHAAMPMSIALRKCPQAVVLPPSRGLYSQFSAQVFAIVESVTPEYTQVSVDEGYIDVASAQRRSGSPRQIAASLRARIEAATGLTASVGAAPTMVLAKMASTRAKPDGLLVVSAADAPSFLNPMPVEALPGVGARTQEVLASYGIRRIGQLAQSDPAWLRKILGSHGSTLSAYARGEDSRTVHERARDHTISAEHTFSANVYDPDRLRRELFRLADTVAYRLRGEGVAAGSVGLKYRTGEFSTYSRSVTLQAPSDVAAELHTALLRPLMKLHESNRRGVRLLGLRAADLVPIEDAGRQETLGVTERAPRDAELALDAVRKKFGKAAISPASLLPESPAPDAASRGSD